MARGKPLLHYSNWVFVMKSNSQYRLCCDFININMFIKTINKIVHMGSPKQVFHRFFNQQFCWVADLKHAFWSIPVTNKTRLYYGMYSYKTFQDYIGFTRLCMGEKSATYSFNRMVNLIFGNFHNFLVNWVDDFIVLANSQQELNQNFQLFVETVGKNGLSLSPSKMDFNKTSVMFLGKEIFKDKQCIQVPLAKIQGLQNIKPPVDYKSLRSFLGSLIFYGSHFRNIGIASFPLHQLLRQQTKKPFKWDTKMQEAFLEVKSCIADAVLLYFPYKDGIFELYTDASKFTYSMVLYSRPKLPKLGKPRLIAMHSSAFKGHQLNWSIFHKEFWTVVYAVTTRLEFLHGNIIHVFSDARSLLYASERKADSSITYRLALLLASLNIQFFHCKGTANKSDHSSRDRKSVV